MEWSKLGELLGSSLGAGLNTYGDISLNRKAQQQEFAQRKQMMIEQEAAKQRAIQAKQQERDRIAKLYGDLASGRDPFQNQGMPENGEMPNMQPGQGMSPLGQQGMMPQEGGMPPQNNGPMQQPGKLSMQERLDRAIAAGLGPNEISKLQMAWEKERANELAQDKLSWQKEEAEKNRRLKEEAPQRKAVTQQVNKALETLPFIEKEIGYYEALKKLPESGKLRQGNWRKVLDKVGLGDLWQSPESDLAEKLISNIAVSQAQGATNFGQATNDKLELIQKANPTLLQSPKGFEAAIEMNIRSKKVDKAIADELQKISKESKGVYPLDAMSMALERAKPKIEKLHKQQLDIATMLTLPDASRYKGKGMEDEETGTIFVSDGKSWKPVKR